MEATYGEAKFTEMLLYVASKLRDDKTGGATKLNKMLYFADFANVRRFGQPISGAEYRKRPYGPAPHRLIPVRERLMADEEAEIVVDDFLGHEVHRLVPLRDADLSTFTADELATIDKVLADLDHLTATQVTDLSHDEPWWPFIADGDVIEYHMAFAAPEQRSTPTSRRLAAVVAERYGLASQH